MLVVSHFEFRAWPIDSLISAPSKGPCCVANQQYMVQTPRDPWVTASRLVGFVIAYDIVLALLQISTSLLTGGAINPVDRVWDFREIQFSSIPGYNMAFVHVVTAIACVPIQVVLIQKAKLVLDFGLTVQGAHLLCTWLYSGRLPTTGAWWSVWLLCNTIIVFGGEYACMRIELKPINFGPGDASSNAGFGRVGNNDTRTSQHQQPNDHEGEAIELQERDKLLEEGNTGG